MVWCTFQADVLLIYKFCCWAYSRPFWITSFEFCGIRFSIWKSFIDFCICYYPIITILACLFSVGVRISWKKLCWMRAWRRRWHLVSPTLYIIIVYRVNLNKLSRNFVGAIRTTTTNCRVSFIDLYLLFPTNFRIVFLPHTNTVILLESYCGTITEPGLPVVLVHGSFDDSSYFVHVNINKFIWHILRLGCLCCMHGVFELFNSIIKRGVDWELRLKSTLLYYKHSKEPNGLLWTPHFPPKFSS